MKHAVVPIRVQVFVRLKPGVLDVQGKAVERGLADAGVVGVDAVRIGRLIEFEVTAQSPAEARTMSEELCRKLLVNQVMERAEIRILEGETSCSK